MAGLENKGDVAATNLQKESKPRLLVVAVVLHSSPEEQLFSPTLTASV